MTAANTLPARYYTDPGLFRDEMEMFWFGRWICAGREEYVETPGSWLLRDIAGESVIVTRDAGGVLQAFYNVCRHRGTRICTEPAGNFGVRIQCPYHGWTYGLDGRLLGAPHMAPGFCREEYRLHAVHTSTWDGHIFLHLGNEPEDLATALGRLPEKFANWRMQDLRRHERIKYDVQANWKLVILNFNECLHCPVLHPALNRLTDYLGADNEPAAPGYIGGSMGFRDGAETMSLDGKRRRAFLPGLTEEERKMVHYYAVYPNLLLSLHPDYMMVHTLWPEAVDRTHIECEWFFHPAEMQRPDFNARDAVEFWDITNREDWGIVEQSQAGISSRAYCPGPYSPRESLLHNFDEFIRGCHARR